MVLGCYVDVRKLGSSANTAHGKRIDFTILHVLYVTAEAILRIVESNLKNSML